MWKHFLIPITSVLAITACVATSSEGEAHWELAFCGGAAAISCGPGYVCSYDHDADNDGILEGTCARPTGCGGGYATRPSGCSAGYRCEGEVDADNDGILEPGQCIFICGGPADAKCGPGYTCSYDRDPDNDGILEGACVRPTGCGGGYASSPTPCPVGYSCQGEVDADNDGILEPGSCVKLDG